MRRHKAIYKLAPGQAAEIKQGMLSWSKQFSILLFLDSNNYPSIYDGYECLLATGAMDNSAADDLTLLRDLHNDRKDWLFGHISYDYKNVLEPKLSSGHPARNGFPLLHFFTPETVCHINRQQTQLTIESFAGTDDIYRAIVAADIAGDGAPIPRLQFANVIPKHDYLDTISKLRRHIADGDCYEINFCNEGYCHDAVVSPPAIFNALTELSPAPFAAYYRLHDKYLMCASPERYLRKTGDKVMSQPIKGTARRDADPLADTAIRNALRADIKELAENVMIVDLVRNDLARHCDTGSVHVDELFGIYSFPQVHQMISTVSGSLRKDLHFTDAIRHSFPMGSMTGAPKFKVMELIEKYEQSRRELFSGTVGYITPDGDFDFNVVIRSLFYNETSRYLCYQAGGAITYDSDAGKEWDEMRLKAWALERIFS